MFLSVANYIRLCFYSSGINILSAIISTTISVAVAPAAALISLTAAAIAYWSWLCEQSQHMRAWVVRSRDLEQKFPQLIGLIDLVQGPI